MRRTRNKVVVVFPEILIEPSIMSFIYTEEQCRVAWAAYFAQQQQPPQELPPHQLPPQELPPHQQLPQQQLPQQQLQHGACSTSKPAQPDESGYATERAAAWKAYYAQLAAYQQHSSQAALGYQRQLATQPALPAPASDCWPDGTPKRFKTSRPAAAGTAGIGLSPQPRPDVAAAAAADSGFSSAEVKLAQEPAAKRQKTPPESQPASALSDSSVAALCEAVANGDVRETQRQLETGVKIDSLGPDGKSALMLACKHGHSIVAVALLDARPPPRINRRGIEGKAALHYAILNDDKVRSSSRAQALLPSLLPSLLSSRTRLAHA